MYPLLINEDADQNDHRSRQPDDQHHVFILIGFPDHDLSFIKYGCTGRPCPSNWVDNRETGGRQKGDSRC